MAVRHQREWRIQAKKADFDAIGRRFGISPVTARLIRNRDVIGEEAVDRYLHAGLADLYDPALMKDLDKAVGMLLSAARDGKTVRIIGDYDCDGICSIAILIRGLAAVGLKASWDIPDRVMDGYGLNERFVREAARDGVDVLLTCDNGIAAIGEIALAKELGLSVIVTDHHELPVNPADPDGPRLVPAADAVVNPKQPDCGYPFKGLCGAGICFKLIGHLLQEAGVPDETAGPLLSELLEYTAIATVADVMDLVDENRILVREGLARIRRTTQPGLSALIEGQKLDRSRISAYHIGFIIGPTLNAAGRLESAKESVMLLMTGSMDNARMMAEHLIGVNEERKRLTQENIGAAMKLLEEEGWEEKKVLVVYLPGCHESLAGIVAGRIRETCQRPAIVLTDGAEGLKGSARSVEAYHMFNGIAGCAALLSHYGGHPMAAGLSMPKENLEAFAQQINENCTQTIDELIPRQWIDLQLPFQYVSERLIKEIEWLEPFGKGNTKPVFAERGLKVARLQVVGRNRQIIKLTLVNESGTVMEGVYFGDPENFLAELEEDFGADAVSEAKRGHVNPLRIHILYYPEVDDYRGGGALQAVVTDWRPAGR